MKRITISIPDELAEALEKVVKLDPLRRSRSAIISEALTRYIASKYPNLLRHKEVKGPTVISALKIAKLRAPSLTLRRTRLKLPEWVKVED
ncbi:MAG TPA: ribbon-helix-helix protein, CopG family [Thermofilum sp.]|nr:ribbon-helix-helix protein, CopG family [Thermofilum sp.]